MENARLCMSEGGKALGVCDNLSFTAIPLKMRTFTVISEADGTVTFRSPVLLLGFL